MAIATNQQVQTYADQRVRPHAETLRAFVAAIADDKAAIDDVYAACAQGNPTWSDNRTDGPPHLLTPASILSYNAFISDVKAYIIGHGEYANVLAGCVQPVRSN